MFTLAYNVIEGVVAVWTGQVAGSVALVGFGFDSAVETLASAVLLWRMNVQARGAPPERVADAERAVCRVVGVTFVLLIGYVLLQAGWNLYVHQPAEVSPIGIGLAVASVVVMPFLTLAKLRVARGLGSAALRAEAKGTLACSLLSIPLLVGLVANAALGWWWADPLAAVCMVPWLIKEARQALRGESCCGSASDPPD
jgi:divalent metal cation (Fe/Co/Zn/Cd) transporter